MKVINEKWPRMLIKEEIVKLGKDLKDAYKAFEEIDKEDRLFQLGEMFKAPCFCCGYNGTKYFQPKYHKCMERHHKLYSDNK